MFSKRDFMLFIAGALALHAAINLLFSYSGIAPLKMYRNLVNIQALLASSISCIVLLWWADRLGKEKPSFWKW